MTQESDFLRECGITLHHSSRWLSGLAIARDAIRAFAARHLTAGIQAL